ncbi:MAG: hypothetical protein ACM3XO_01365 [Bacteroidota bacterium]
MNTRPVPIFLSIIVPLAVVLTACSSRAETLPTPTSLPTFFPAVTSTSMLPLPTSGALTPGVPVTQAPGTTDICTDPQAAALIDSLKMAVSKQDGPLLSSLVSPSSGLEVSYFHNGNAIKYDQNQAKFLFETTYPADWGADPASGAEKIGPFHEVVVPALAKIFNQPYELHCNELKYGGASYPVKFPYDKPFYSIYFPGTQANGNMDWQTWVAGIEYVNGKPYLYALMQFFWEP